MTTINSLKGADRIDTRDIIEAADELRQEILDSEAAEDYYVPTDDEQELLEFDESQGNGYIEDYSYGAQMIREDEFDSYARNYAEEVGRLPQGDDWPLYCIDWEWAARELAHDYATVEFLGYTYYVR